MPPFWKESLRAACLCPSFWDCSEQAPPPQGTGPFVHLQVFFSPCFRDSLPPAQSFCSPPSCMQECSDLHMTEAHPLIWEFQRKKGVLRFSSPGIFQSCNSPPVSVVSGAERRKIGPLIYCWWECRLVRPLWKAFWQFLKKIKLELPMTQPFHS